MFRKLPLAAALAGALWIAGCSTQPGQKLLTYNAATTTLPNPSTANRPGYYALYPDDGITPTDTIFLKQGEEFGFRRNADGQIVGYADGKEYSLNAVLANQYSWRYVGEEKPK